MTGNAWTNHGKQGLFLRIAAIVGIFGSLVLLPVGAAYGILSPREFGIGLLLWFAMIVAIAIVRRLTVKPSATGSQIAVDERARRRILRGIRMNKIWIGLLLVCLRFRHRERVGGACLATHGSRCSNQPTPDLRSSATDQTAAKTARLTSLIAARLMAFCVREQMYDFATTRPLARTAHPSRLVCASIF
jgi:hypothetical protein